MPEEKDSIMKLLLSTSSHANKVDSWKTEQNKNDCGTTSRLSSYLQQLSGQIDGLVNTVDLDHNYSRPWNWRPENSCTKPVRTLFVSRIPNTIARASVESIDPENDPVPPVPPYDISKAKILMDECERHIKSIRPDIADTNWETNLNKSDWTDVQKRLFDRIVRLLNSDMLARLSTSGSWNEPVLRRISVNKTARRLRSTLASVSWEPKLVQWLHNVLMENLDNQYLIAYIDVLQTLKSKVPSLVERMLSNQTSIGKWNTDALDMLLQRPWDPAAFGLSCYNPHYLPGNPLLLMVPNGINSGNQQNSRFQSWQSYLSQLGSVVTVNPPSNYATNKVTITSSLEQMMIATRSKISELRSDYIGRKIVLIGLNTGAALACQVALLEHVTSVICLGFPLSTVEDKRGQPDDNILNLNCPVLFVIGQHASTANVDDMEDLREKLHVETGLVVVGAADDQLRISKGKQRAEGITQSMVDRCVVDEVGDFIAAVLSNPYSVNRNSGDVRPRYKLIEKKRKIALQDDMYSKKQHISTILSQEGSVLNTTVIRKPRIPRSNPPSRSKWTAQVHRAIDSKQRAQSGSVASITRTPNISDKSQSLPSRPSIDNISVMNSTMNGDGSEFSLGESSSDPSLDTSSTKLLPQIKVVLGSEECGIATGVDASSLVDHLTPDSLLEMPVIIAQEDTQESPVKVVVSNKPGPGIPSIRCVPKGPNSKVKCTKILLCKKDMNCEKIKPPTVYVESRSEPELKHRIRHIPATKHSNSGFY